MSEKTVEIGLLKDLGMPTFQDDADDPSLFVCCGAVVYSLQYLRLDISVTAIVKRNMRMQIQMLTVCPCSLKGRRESH
jgi:hypothetical protein